MTFSLEAQLFGIALALYVSDAILLLYPNEGLLTAIGKGQWRVTFGSDTTRVRGKEVLFPSLILIHRPCFKLSWDYERVNREIRLTTDWLSRAEQFRALSPLVYGIAFAQLVIFPYAILIDRTDMSIMIALIYLYGTILAGLIWVWFQRQKFCLDNKGFTLLGFECLICPPLALNLVRKLSLKYCSSNDDLLLVAQELLQESAWHEVKKSFCDRLDEEIDAESETSARLQMLRAHRSILSEERV
jgi:hypothetical protein